MLDHRRHLDHRQRLTMLAYGSSRCLVLGLTCSKHRVCFHETIIQLNFNLVLGNTVAQYVQTWPCMILYWPVYVQAASGFITYAGSKVSFLTSTLCQCTCRSAVDFKVELIRLVSLDDT